MKIHYLEIVSTDVEAICRAYEVAHNVTFKAPDEALGGARTVTLSSGSIVSVRGLLGDVEQPIVRPYWLVDNIEEALATAVAQGAEVAHSPLEIPGKGTFAIYIQGGIEHGLWQL